MVGRIYAMSLDWMVSYYMFENKILLVIIGFPNKLGTQVQKTNKAKSFHLVGCMRLWKQYKM